MPYYVPDSFSGSYSAEIIQNQGMKKPAAG
jgi:hypothetical protein